MSGVSQDGSLGPSHETDHFNKQLVLHKGPPRKSYAQAVRAEPPAREEPRVGRATFNYGVARPPVYLHFTPEEPAADREEVDCRNAAHEASEKNIRDVIARSNARSETWAKKIEYERSLSFAPQGTLFHQPCAIGHERHFVFSNNGGVSIQSAIICDGRVVGCLFCMPSTADSHMLPLVASHYASLPRPPLPRPIGHEIKVKQAKQQAADSRPEKGNHQQPSVSDLPMSMRRGLPPRVTESLKPYQTSPDQKHSALALLSRDTEHSQLLSHGNPSQSARPLTLYSNQDVRYQGSISQDVSNRTYGMSTQDIRAHNSGSFNAKPQASRLSSSQLDPTHPEFIPRAQACVYPDFSVPQVITSKANSEEQALSSAFAQSLSVQDVQQQSTAPQDVDVQDRASFLRSEENALVLNVPVPRRHIPAEQVQQFDATLQGLPPPQPQLPYNTVPPPPESLAPTTLAVSHPSAALASTYWYNGALHNGPLYLQDHQPPLQEPYIGQQSQILPQPQLPEQAVAEPPNNHGLWIPHEHLDEIGALPSARARMMSTQEETYNKGINRQPGRFPLSNVRSTSQHLTPDGRLHSHYRDENLFSNGNAYISGSNDGDVGMREHPGNTTNVSIFEHRLAAQDTRGSFHGHRKRKYQRSRQHASPGNAWATQELINGAHEQQQLVLYQQQLQQLRLQQQQQDAEKRDIAEQKALAAAYEGYWTRLATGQITYIALRPRQPKVEVNDVTMHSHL